MTQRSRKFAGVWLLLALVVVYPLLGTLFYATFLVGWPTLVLLAYFFVVGVGWALPAGIIIKWMAKPDPTV